ncbi:hypothetical protein ACFQH7_19600 [Microbulbifer taiwanensis]
MQHRDQSREDASPIQPADFSFGSENPQRQSAKGSPAKHSAKSGRSRAPAAAVGGLLLVGVVGVFWLLPQLVEKPQPRLPTVSGPTSNDKAAPGVQASPTAMQKSPSSGAMYRRSCRKSWCCRKNCRNGI